jgi:uncharacterized iron-regulated membrane protein
MLWLLNNWRLVAVVGMTAGAFFAGAYANGMRWERNWLEREAELAVDANAAQQMVREAVSKAADKAIAQERSLREQAENAQLQLSQEALRARRQADALRGELSEIYITDEAAQDWSGVDIPAAVRCGLWASTCHGEAGDSGGGASDLPPDSAEPDGALPSAAVDPPD